MAGKRQEFEDAEQEALFVWANMATHRALPAGETIGSYLFAIPNGGKRNVREAARLKRQGVKAGVSDTLLPIPLIDLDGNMQIPGLWIEMKKQRQHFKSMNAAEKAMSDSQVDWFKKMSYWMWETECCYGWEDASKKIIAYLDRMG